MARKKADEINLNGYQDSDYDNLTVSDTDYSECSVSGADNVLSESASDNKKVFDTFPKMIAAKFNGLIKKLKNGNLVQDANYVHTDNNFTDEHKETVDNLPGDVSNIKEQLKNGNFVQDANYVHTDNNFTDYYKDAVDVSHDHALAAMSIAQGANQAVSFNNYQEMVNFFNFNPNWGFVDNFEKRYNIGQNIMIGTVNVPDLWIAETAYDVGFEEYNYVSDEDFIKDINSALENGEFLRVGYVRLGVLETQKVDLTDYVKDKNYVHTENNFSDYYKNAVSEMFAQYTACVEAFTIQFDDYMQLIEWFNKGYGVPNDWGEPTELTMYLGQVIAIDSVDLPDLVVCSVSYNEDPVICALESNEQFLEKLNEEGSVWVGYYKFRAAGVKLEGMKANCVQRRKCKNSTASLTPETDTVYLITEDTEVTLPQHTLFPTSGSYAEEYCFSVDTALDVDGNIVPSITFTNVIKWASPFEIKADTHYEIAIRNGYGVIAEFNEVIE